jgi:hypothetical protein
VARGQVFGTVRAIGLRPPLLAASGAGGMRGTDHKVPRLNRQFHHDESTAVVTRRRITQTSPLEIRLAEEAKRLHEEAESLPPGAKREEMIRKARQAETGSHMSEWLRSPGLQPPE